MKRLLSVLLVLCLICSGCGSAQPTSQSTAPAQSSAPEEEAAALQTTVAAEPNEESPGPVAKTGWNQSVLTEEEITALLSQSPEKARDTISTTADAIRYLDRKYPALAADSAEHPDPIPPFSYITQPAVHTYQAPDQLLLLSGEDAEVGGQDIANLMAYLLEDDMPIGILFGLFAPEFVTVRTAEYLDNWEFTPPAAANYIFTEAGYVVLSPQQHLSADRSDRRYALPEGTFASLEDYGAHAGDLTQNLLSLWTWEHSGSIYLELDLLHFHAKALNPDARELFFAQNLVPDRFRFLSNYSLADVPGGYTLTEQEASELVTQTPEQIREAVKTPGDMLMYLMAARYRLLDGPSDEIIWRYNEMDIPEIVSHRMANCSSVTHLAWYLLEGDYDEIGYIFMDYAPPNPIDHSIFYIGHQGKYYVIDLVQFIGKEYRDQKVIVVDSLEEFGELYQNYYAGTSVEIAEAIAYENFQGPGKIIWKS